MILSSLKVAHPTSTWWRLTAALANVGHPFAALGHALKHTKNSVYAWSVALHDSVLLITNHRRGAPGDDNAADADGADHGSEHSTDSADGDTRHTPQAQARKRLACGREDTAHALKKQLFDLSRAAHGARARAAENWRRGMRSASYIEWPSGMFADAARGDTVDAFQFNHPEANPYAADGGSHSQRGNSGDGGSGDSTKRWRKKKGAPELWLCDLHPLAFADPSADGNSGAANVGGGAAFEGGAVEQQLRSLEDRLVAQLKDELVASAGDATLAAYISGGGNDADGGSGGGGDDASDDDDRTAAENAAAAAALLRGWSAEELAEVVALLGDAPVFARAAASVRDHGIGGAMLVDEFGASAERAVAMLATAEWSALLRGRVTALFRSLLTDPTAEDETHKAVKKALEARRGRADAMVTSSEPRCDFRL